MQDGQARPGLVGPGPAAVGVSELKIGSLATPSVGLAVDVRVRSVDHQPLPSEMAAELDAQLPVLADQVGDLLIEDRNSPAGVLEVLA